MVLLFSVTPALFGFSGDEKMWLSGYLGRRCSCVDNQSTVLVMMTVSVRREIVV